MKLSEIITIYLDNLKFSASILDNQEPFLKCSAICINSALVDLSESSRGDMFLVSEIREFTVWDGELS